MGDSRREFTIQSISKPFVYGLALADHVRAEVLAKIGVEPTGDAFNSISLDPGTGRPRNPMINAGAIASTGLVEGRDEEMKMRRVMEMFAHCAGRPLSIDESVYRSESATGHRNRAIGHMLRNFGILTGDPMPVVERYFRQCSILGHCRDLATMAATLANRGANPITGGQAIRGEYVESILGVATHCGNCCCPADSCGERGRTTAAPNPAFLAAVSSKCIGSCSPLPCMSFHHSARISRRTKCPPVNPAWASTPFSGCASISRRYASNRYRPGRAVSWWK